MLYARVVITDLDGVDHTITPSGMGDTDVLDVGFAHKAADDFVFTIGDKTGTIKDWLKRGCIAKIYIDTDSPPTTLKLNSMVEEVTLIEPVPDFVLFKVEGREVFHVVINNRIVTETYLDTEVSAIIRDLLFKYSPYPGETALAMSFYEGTGLTAHDESRYLNHGTITGWLAGWKKRLLFSIDKTKIDGDLTDFTILIHLSDSSGIGGVDTTCVFDELGAESLKIAVVVAGAECYVEVDTWDAVAKEAWLWVKVPTVHAAFDDVLSLFYGADHADNTDKVGLPNSVAAENVWDANFQLVTHMQDDPDNAHVRDSTTNDNDGTKLGANEPIEVDGEIGKAQGFDGADDVITIASDPSLDITDIITVEATITPEAVAFDSWMCKKGVYRSGRRGSKLVFYLSGIDVAVFDYQFPVMSVPYRVVMTYDKDARGANLGQKRLSINGALVDTMDCVGALNVVDDVTYIGATNPAAERYEGIEDECRVSDSIRSADWIKADYENLEDNLLTFRIEAGDYGPWVDGKYGKAIEFGGDVGNYLTIGSAGDIQPESITVMAWFYLYDFESHYTGNWSHHIYPLADGFGIATNSATNWVIWIRTAGGRQMLNVGGTSVLNGWIHVAQTYDKVTGDQKVYIGAELEAEQNLGAGTPIAWGGGTLRVSTPNYETYGVTDEVRIIDGALTADEIKAYKDYPYLHDIDVTTTTLEDIRFPYRPMKECLEELALLSGFSYLGNPNTVMLWKEEASEDSGFTYTEANIEATPEVIETLLPIKNRVYVIGGNYMQADQEQTTIASTKNTKDKWYAQTFTPTRSGLDQISLHLKKTGDPDDLEGQIRTDDPGNGPAAIIATFTVDTDFIGTTATWRPIDVSASLLIGYKYWIVLKKNGDGANNYEWSDDDGGAGVNANSDTGAAGDWVINAASYQMAYKTQYRIPILARASDYAHSDIYKWREIVIEDKSIMTRTLARETADSRLADLKDMTAQARDIMIGGATGIPELGKLVTITLANLGVSAVQYVAKEAKVKFKGGEDGTFFLDLRLGREASELAEWLRDLKSEVDRTKVGAFGVDRGLINLIRDLSDTAEATDDNLVATVQLSGTFEIDTARIDFSDIG